MKINLIQEVIKKIKLINMWDIIHLYNMKDFFEALIKWFKCKFCCQSECSVGEDKTNYDYYSGRRKSI